MSASIPILPLLSSRFFELTVLPTEQCNLRCQYCYEDFKMGKMERPIVEGLKLLLRKRSVELTQLRLKWFGGEPLLAKEIVLEISAFAQTVAAQSGAVFVGSITTNGVLLDTGTFRNLTSAGIRGYQVALDGPKDVHDRKRVNAVGRGSFEQIWRNLEAMCDTGEHFDAVIRLHVTPETYEACRAFVVALKSAFGADQRFRLFVKPIQRLGSKNDHSISSFGGGNEHALLEDLNLRFRPMQGSQASRSAPCYAAHANSFVIRADGSVGKCTVALNDDRNRIGQLCSDGRIEIDDDRHAPWLRGLISGDERALTCPLAGMKYLTIHKGHQATAPKTNY